LTCDGSRDNPGYRHNAACSDRKSARPNRPQFHKLVPTGENTELNKHSKRTKRLLTDILIAWSLFEDNEQKENMKQVTYYICG
jgi:hypothetical protein